MTSIVHRPMPTNTGPMCAPRAPCLAGGSLFWSNTQRLMHVGLNRCIHADMHAYKCSCAFMHSYIHRCTNVYSVVICCTPLGVLRSSFSILGPTLDLLGAHLGSLEPLWNSMGCHGGSLGLPNDIYKFLPALDIQLRANGF